MENYSKKSVYFIREEISKKLNEFSVVDQFLIFQNSLILDEDDLNQLDTDLYSNMINYKELAQVSLNLYQNYYYMQNCIILEKNQTQEYQSFAEKHQLRTEDQPHASVIKPDPNTVVDYLIKYMSYHIALERSEVKKNDNDFRSLIKSTCLFCDHRLDGRQCRVCDTTSIDMRQYAQLHHRTLRRLRARSKTKYIPNFSEQILESENQSMKALDIRDKSRPSLDSSMPKDKWICEKCGFFNTSTITNCFICFTMNKDQIIEPKNFAVLENVQSQSNGINHADIRLPIVMQEKVQSQRNEINNVDKKEPIVVQENVQSQKNDINHVNMDLAKNYIVKKAPNSYHCKCEINYQGKTIKWRCWNPSCQKTNYNCANYCGKCGVQRKLARLILRHHQGKLEEIWMCDICSQFNQKHSIKCKHCSRGKKNGCTQFYAPFYTPL